MDNINKTKEELIAEIDNLRQKIVLSKVNETNFREVLENSIDAAYKRNLETNSYEYFSPVFVKIAGYTSDEMKSMPLETVLSLIHPDDIPEIDKVFKKSLIPPFGVSHQIEYRFKDKINDTYHWICDQYIVMNDSKGYPKTLIGCVSEISKRKHFEQELIESNAKLQNIFNNLQDAYFEADTKGKFTTVSPSALYMYGYSSAEELIGQPATNLYANPTDRDKLIKELSTKSKIIDFTLKAIRKDKTTFWVSMNVQLKYDIIGRYIGTVGVVRDITERIINDEKTKQSEENFRDIYDNAIEGIYRASIEGQILQANKSLAKILGYESPKILIDTIKNTRLQVLVNPSDELKYDEVLDKEGIIEGYECKFKRKDGEEIWASLNAKLIYDNKGEKLYYEGFAIDITARKNKELEIQKKMADLQWHYDIAIRRELKMAELKNEINDLLLKLGKEKKYGV